MSIELQSNHSFSDRHQQAVKVIPINSAKIKALDVNKSRKLDYKRLYTEGCIQNIL